MDCEGYGECDEEVQEGAFCSSLGDPTAWPQEGGEARPGADCVCPRGAGRGCGGGGRGGGSMPPQRGILAWCFVLPETADGLTDFVDGEGAFF